MHTYTLQYTITATTTWSYIVYTEVYRSIEVYLSEMKSH